MTRPVYSLAGFGLATALLLAAMAMLTFAALRLDARERDSSARAELEERVRLALWRMDAVAAPVVAIENARPYFQYAAFYPAERAYSAMFAPIAPGDIQVPSPLLTFSGPYVKVHFQYGPDGSLTSPQAPDGNMRDLAETGYREHEAILESAALLARVHAIMPFDALRASLMVESPTFGAFDAVAPAQQTSTEYGLRKEQVIKQAMSNVAAESQPQPKQSFDQAAADFEELRQSTTPDDVLGAPMMQAFWAGEELLLARRVSVNGSEYLQGCWINWPALSKDLKVSIADLLPGAVLHAVDSSANSETERQLASLPVLLEPGQVAASMASAASPIRVTLLIAWCCLILAVGAVGFLFAGTIALSERRAAFVSAVTHELRTPLTTFRLYTDLLAEGRITDEAKRAAYLETLRNESNRLAHLVENVLAYARLEPNQPAARAESITIGELAARIEERLNNRCAQDGIELRSDFPNAAADIVLVTNPDVVEQILMNLVDNACKYSGTVGETVIDLTGRIEGGQFVVRVRDYGPGISEQAARRLFQPFAKRPHESAGSPPGVGLGLALSRRLARALGGDLRNVAQVHPGCCLELVLPLT